MSFFQILPSLCEQVLGQGKEGTHKTNIKVFVCFIN